MKYWLHIALLLAALPTLAKEGSLSVKPTVQLAGDNHATFWLTAPKISPPFSVYVSGDGITLTDEPYLVPGTSDEKYDEVDGVVVDLKLDWQATPGPRDVWLEDTTGLRVIRSAFTVLTARSPIDKYAQAIRVEAVSRASPSYARPGEQVNLWLVGRGFEPGSTVSFDKPGLGPAIVNGQPLPTEVFLRSQGVNGELDGLQYYLQVGGPDDVMPGDVNITVTNLDGTTATGQRLLQILQPGQTMPPPDMNKPLDAITGASPRAVFLGRNVSLWIWGEGFAKGARVEFLSSTGAPYPGIQAYAESEVVERSTSHPGFSGIRNFLLIDEMAPQGSVDVRITNPNGSTQTARGLFNLVAATDGAVGMNGNYGSGGGCPPEGTPIREITSVVPGEVTQGDGFELLITGYGFACGAAVSISNGGMSEVSPLVLVPETANSPAVLSWRLKVLETARPGPRTVAVINPDNASKVVEGAFTVLPSAQLSASPGCVLDSTPKSPVFAMGLLLLIAFGSSARSRKS